MSDFKEFSKIPRLNRDCTITEKLDGTNALVAIGENGEFEIGSRSRWITPEDDNYGFARWAYDNKEELLKLGVGWHYGEWWGQGVQRKYNLKEKRFSLFNTYKWSDENVRPKCCHVVPVLYKGPFSTNVVNTVLEMLKTGGSVAAPGFSRAEGIIIFHEACRHYFKVTCENDEKAKSEV